ncbi:hypothetical protein D083_1193 [Dickeya solani RNS 08.23.3.1.A]|nr:hypothetical protein D083_1193 [Dickeya solani RNS 08.23.3.1.A]
MLLIIIPLICYFSFFTVGRYWNLAGFIYCMLTNMAGNVK